MAGVPGLETSQDAHWARDHYWADLVALQGGEFCAACGSTEKLHLDHDHNAGCGCGRYKRCPQCIRGILCVRCNQIAGRIESPRYEGVLAFLASQPRPLMIALEL